MFTQRRTSISSSLFMKYHSLMNVSTGHMQSMSGLAQRGSAGERDEQAKYV